MVTVKTEEDNNIVYTVASKKLTAEDYDKFIPLLEEKIKQFGTARWYFEAEDFDGWEPKALAKDLKFDAKHINDLEKIAVVGQKKWQEWMTDLIKPFTKADTKYFDESERPQAKRWIGSKLKDPEDGDVK